MLDEDTVLGLTKKLLDCIPTDWNTYASLCDENMTAFEPEACGSRVDGLGFHEHYFQSAKEAPPGAAPRIHQTIVSPAVRKIGPEGCIVTYVRIVQVATKSGEHQSLAFEETRVWERRPGSKYGWVHVHFHRSRVPASYTNSS